MSAVVGRTYGNVRLQADQSTGAPTYSALETAADGPLMSDLRIVRSTREL